MGEGRGWIGGGSGWMGSGGGSGRIGGGGVRVDGIEELKFWGKFTIFFFGLGGWSGGDRVGVGIRLDVNGEKIQNKKMGGLVGDRVWGVRVDLNEELEVFGKIQKIGGGQVGCERRENSKPKKKLEWGSGRGGVGLLGGQGGCERNVGGRG